MFLVTRGVPNRERNRNAMKELTDSVRREVLHSFRAMRMPGVRAVMGAFSILDTLMHLVVWGYFIYKVIL